MPIFSRFWTNPQTNQSDPTQLQANGPALQVEISVSERLASLLTIFGKSIPNPRTGWGLIDTGASITAVDSAVLDSLALNPFSKTKVLTPGGESIQGVYACRIGFPGTPIPTLEFNPVIGSQLQTQGYIALIGRDLLRHFQLVYNGLEGFWTIAF